jgi:hypothetical protein
MRKATRSVLLANLGRCVRHIWIFAGDEALDSSGPWADALKDWCSKSKCPYMPVALEGKRVLGCFKYFVQDRLMFSP